jgi:hypothetical protein
VTEGRYAPDGYATALAILAVLQALVIAWLLPMRDPFARKALS